MPALLPMLWAGGMFLGWAGNSKEGSARIPNLHQSARILHRNVAADPAALCFHCSAKGYGAGELFSQCRQYTRDLKKRLTRSIINLF
jgi:hypothetical protein